LNLPQPGAAEKQDLSDRAFPFARKELDPQHGGALNLSQNFAMKKTARNRSAPFQKTLISAGRNVRLADWQITSKVITRRAAAPFSVRKLTLHGGKQEGVDLVIVDNGCLRITLIPTRGLGVLQVECGDVRLGWDSPVKEIVHPNYVNLPTRGGLGWLDGFNEWMVRCGLENCGGPGRDSFVTNTGAIAEMDLWLHGKIANIPASEVDVVIDRQPPHTIRIRGRVDERMFYGPKLELATELATEPGSSRFTITDTVTNRGASEQEFQLLYHVNFGTPLLEAGARVIGPIQQVTPFNETAVQGVGAWSEYLGPTPGFVEQVFCLRPYADPQGCTTLMLQNAQADRAASMRFAVAQLPCISLWKSTAAVEEGYVTGIEPATGFPNTRRIERQLGRVPRLGSGSSRTFAIEYAVLRNSAEVAQATREIERIRDGCKTQVDSKPEKR
jgi:hypothetical protein